MDSWRGWGVAVMARRPTQNEGEEAFARGPSMTRSQAQIAMSYAPGQHFTFEGAAGACQAIASTEATPAKPSATTRVQIEMRINEAARAWFDKALSCRDGGNPPALAHCLSFASTFRSWTRRVSNTHSARKPLSTCVRTAWDICRTPRRFFVASADLSKRQTRRGKWDNGFLNWPRSARTRDGPTIPPIVRGVSSMSFLLIGRVPGNRQART